MASHKSNSSAQSAIEDQVRIRFLKENHFTPIAGKGLKLGPSKIDVDIHCHDREGTEIIGGIFIRVNPLKPGQRRKVASDILKLVSYKKQRGDNSIKVVVLLMDSVYDKLLGTNSWIREVVNIWDVDLKRIVLLPEELELLEMTVRNQSQGNVVKLWWDKPGSN